MPEPFLVKAASNFTKKRLRQRCVIVNYPCEMFQNSCFREHLRAAASMFRHTLRVHVVVNTFILYFAT